MTGGIFSAESFFWSCLWQSTIFLVAGLLGSFLLRHRSARAHRVLFLAMIASVIVPAASLLVKHYELGFFVAEPIVIQPSTEYYIIHETTGIISNEATERSRAPINQDLHPAMTSSGTPKLPWNSALLYAWIAASLILVARLIVTFVLGARLLHRAMPLNSNRIEQAIHPAKTKLGISKEVMIYGSAKIRSPVIWCWRRKPILLVPSAAGRCDTGIDWAGVLCHELAHYKRWDHVAGLLAELTICLLPWQPLLWLVKSRLISLSEQACDDWVVASGQSGTDYAESLLNLTPEGQMAFVPAVVHSKRGLPGRVRRILKDGCSTPRIGAAWASVVCAVTACLTVGIAFAQTKPAGLTGTVKTKLGKSAVIEEPAFPVTMIKGKILDPNNEPAYDARIVALPVTSWGYYIEPWGQNKEGYFELPWSPTWIKKGLPIYLMAVVQDPKSQAALVEVKDPASPVTVQLEPAFAITGKVVDPAGQEIEDCLATISLSSKFKCQAPIYSFRGGKWWERMLSPLPYGAKYKLTVRAKGYQTRQIIVDGTDKSKKLIDLGAITLQPQDRAKPAVAERYADPDLAKEFHKLYSLDKDEIIKLIKPPFVLGRQEYFQKPTSIYPRTFESLESQGALQAYLLWDGKALMETSLTGYTNTHRRPRLEYTLLLTLHMPHYDFNLPEELNIEMPYGDWIVRADSPREEQFRCLEEIIYAETNRAIRFEKRIAEREVIVANGRYEFKPHPSGKYADYIPVMSEDEITKSAKIETADSLPEFLSHLESSLQIKVADETEPMEKTTIRYRQSGGLLGWIKYPEERRWKLNILLDNLAKTTSLQFKVERRPAEMWVVTEETKN
jgi:beta-lactamase regulating signal transducer with metallopeptidase domain